jgi:hypothetical protein
MCPAIDNLASREILAVIRFLHAKNMSAAKIHRELCTVYGQNKMSERIIDIIIFQHPLALKYHL